MSRAEGISVSPFNSSAFIFRGNRIFVFIFYQSLLVKIFKSSINIRLFKRSNKSEIKILLIIKIAYYTRRYSLRIARVTYRLVKKKSRLISKRNISNNCVILSLTLRII
jgi:hypothetical protein